MQEGQRLLGSGGGRRGRVSSYSSLGPSNNAINGRDSHFLCAFCQARFSTVLNLFVGDFCEQIRVNSTFTVGPKHHVLL